MSPQTARCVAGLGLAPLLLGLLFFSAEVLDKFASISNRTAWFVAWEVCAVVLLAAWLVIWRRRVAWNPRRTYGTALLGLLLCLGPICTFASLPGRVSQELLTTVPLFFQSVWLFGTAWLWRDANPAYSRVAAGDHAAATVICPQCGYNLRGLREVRCPECGWASTVDDLVERSLAAMSDEESTV